MVDFLFPESRPQSLLHVYSFPKLHAGECLAEEAQPVLTVRYVSRAVRSASGARREVQGILERRNNLVSH